MLRKVILVIVPLILTTSINFTNNLRPQKNEYAIKNISCTVKVLDSKIVDKQDLEQELTKSVEENIIKEQEAKRNETFILTFYTGLEEENSPAGAVNCSGGKLTDGMVANNILPQGTKIDTKEFGELLVADRGGKNFNTSHRLDVFVSRQPGENDYQYKRRVNAMGIVSVKGYIIK